MPTRNEDVKFRLLGTDVSAGQAFSKVAREAQGAHNAISTLGSTLGGVGGAFGPLQNSLSMVSQAFAHVRENGKSTRVVLEGIGLGIAGAGAALLALGSGAQQARAQLHQAITDSGDAFSSFSGRIDATVSQQARFGHAAGDTENALARLTEATQDPAKALTLMGLAADMAAAKHISLTDASQLLSGALVGNAKVFRQFGVVLDGVGPKQEQINRAFAELEKRLGGQAQAQASTFSGTIKGLGVEFENAFEGLTKFAPVLLTVGSGLTVVTSLTGLLAQRRAAQLATNTALIVSENELAASEARAAEAGMLGGARGALGMGLRALPVVGTVAIGAYLANSFITREDAQRQAALDAVAAAPGGADKLRKFQQQQLSQIPSFGGLRAKFDKSAKAALAAAQQQDTQAVAAQTAADQQALASAAQSYFSGLSAFGVLGDGGQAAARKGVTTAHDHLDTALSALHKAQIGPSSSGMTAASARLGAAEANLSKARYVGGTARVDSATAAVAAAQDHLNKLRETGAGSADRLAAAERRVHAARAALADADKKAAETGPLSAGQLLGRLGLNVADQNRKAGDVRKLVHEGLGAAALSQVFDLEKSNPGTLDKLAHTNGKKWIHAMNTSFARLKMDSSVITQSMTDTAAARAAAFANANAYFAALAGAHGPNTALRTSRDGGPARSGSPTVGQGGMYVNSVTVQADDPATFARKMADQQRLRALGASHGR